MSIDNGRWLFVLGAPKCGTTALFELLANNDNFIVPKEKELHFFTRDQATSSYYKAWAPSSLTEYLAMFPEQGDPNSAAIHCDVSPSYLYSRDAILRMKEGFPNSIAVIMLREPVARAFSHYQMDFQKGFVNATLLEVLRRPERFPDHFREYVDGSRYQRYVTQCREIFGDDRLIVVSSKRLRDEPFEVVREIERRFGVTPGNQILEESTANTGFVVRFSLLRRIIAAPHLRALFRLLPMSIRTRIRHMLTRPAPEAKPSDAERTALESLLSSEQRWFQDFLAQEPTSKGRAS